MLFGGLLLSGPPRLRTRDLNAALDSPFALDPAALLQVFTWLGAWAVVLYLLLAYRRYRALFGSMLRNGPIRWYLTFAAFAFVSAMWSSAPLYTLFFAGKLVAGVLVVVLLTVHGAKASLDRPLRILFITQAIKFTLLMLLFFTNRPAVISYTSTGPLGYRLTGGGMLEDYGISPMAVGLWLLHTALFSAKTRRRRWAMVGYVGTWLPLLIAQGRTPIMIAAAGFFIMVSLTPASRNKMGMIVLGILAMVGIMVVGRGDSLIGLATRGGEGVTNFSGRSEAFEYLMPAYRESPIKGHGYGAGTREALRDFPEKFGLGIGAGHDVLSTTLVDVGLIGAVLLGMVFLSTYRQTFVLLRTRRRSRQRVVVAQLACLTLWITLISAFGTGIEGHAPPFLALLATGFASRRQMAIERWERSYAPTTVRAG